MTTDNQQSAAAQLEAEVKRAVERGSTCSNACAS